MSNVETRPVERICRHSPTADDGAAPPAVEVLGERAVPLGGQRAMTVCRTLPQRARSLIGAWCFADRYGPDDIARSGGMDVAPHPHAGLQTVSWLFAGEIEHRDSGGAHALVRPGELNLMTGGHGICHSETSTSATTVLHGVQLWVALPDGHRDAPRDLQHYAPPPVELAGAGGIARVFLGSLCGATSPVGTFSPLLGAELTLAPGARLTLDIDPAFEHGVLVITGGVRLRGITLARGQLGYLGAGAVRLSLENPAGAPALAILLGGQPLHEQLVMWWNFVGRSHEDMVLFRDEWQRESDRFGRVHGYPGQRLPAPPLPHGRLRPRHNPQ